MMAAFKTSIHKLLVGVVHLWVTQHYLENHEIPTNPAVYWVYSHNLEWGDELLKKKRIQITLEVVDH